ncbi:MAG: tetratricopeptide repeat protein [Desulfobulbales bacterium]|nr:tetratricopeptide repeat protein [Desulfobulbales bacterium]
MSLIYDYLKIDGKGDSETHPDIEIPPILKQRDGKRFNNQSLLLLLFTCLAGLLLLLLLINIFTPGHDEETASYNAPAAPKVVEELQPPDPGPAKPKSVATMETEATVSAQETVPAAPLVFPALQKPVDKEAVAQVFESSSRQPGIIRKKTAQPPVLEGSRLKRTLPGNFPVYDEPRAGADEKAIAASEPYDSDSAAVAKLNSSFQAGAADHGKSRKYYLAGKQAQYKGDVRLAEIYYQKAMAEGPGNLEAMINLSALYVQQQRYSDAEEVLTEILAIEPENSKALVNMGMISLNQGNEFHAEERFNAALDANPQEENALVNLAYLAEKNGDHAATESYYRQLLQISPENLEVLLAYGHLLEGVGRYTEAISLYSEALGHGRVKKDKRLHGKISERVRILARVVNNLKP